MSRSLVTGGQGFIGGHLVKALLERGDEVVVLDLPDAPGRALELHGLIDDVELIEGDIADPAITDRAAGGTTSVFHLAAQTLVGPAAIDPVATFRANVEGTWVVLETARKAGVAAVVVASSDKAYGPSDKLPYVEDQELRPAAPYEGSKAAADVISRSYHGAFALPVVVARLANVYGGGDLNGSRLVPEAVTALIAGRAPIIRSDGSPRRDYIHVSDGATAYLAIESIALSGTGAGEAFNAGTGSAHSVREVLDLITAEVGRTATAGAGDRFNDSGRDTGSAEVPAPVFESDGVPDGEIDTQYVDASRLRNLTGWSPAVSLEAGVTEAVAWYRVHAEAG